MRPLKLTAIVLVLTSLILVETGKQPQRVHAARQGEATLAAPVLFGATAGGDGNSPGNFYRIDPSTGVATLVGPVGFNSISAMDFHPFTGVLYAAGHRVSDSRLVLITINTVTGAGTEVSPVGSGFVTEHVQDMTFRNSDAKLFAYFGGSLITINTTTGGGSRIGQIDNFTSGNGLAFSPTDTLFHSTLGILSIIDQTTGGKTVITGLHYPAGFTFSRVAAMKFQPGTSTLYGAVMTGNGVYLCTINTSTGDVAAIGQTASRIDAIAWSPASTGNFDLCLQDESNGNILRVNSFTGEYQLTNCQGFTTGGIGTISTRGCLVTLQVNGPDRRVLARIDTCMKRGTASVQLFSAGRTFSVLDRNTTNNTCACPGG